MKKVLLLGSQHGNELLGEQLYGYINVYHQDLLPHITYRVANSKAQKAGVRFCESDMNRSYGKIKPVTYEEKRARAVELFIAQQAFDMVIDLHTTNCLQPASLMVASLNQINIPCISAFDINRIVVMEIPMVTSSLIGRFESVISLEANVTSVDEPFLENLCQSLYRYTNDEVLNINRYVYHVNKMLLKENVSPETEKELENFKLSQDGFYPILTGNNTYRINTDYLGFRADKLEIIKL